MVNKEYNHVCFCRIISHLYDESEMSVYNDEKIRVLPY